MFFEHGLVLYKMFTYVLTSTYQRGNLDEEWMAAVRGECVWTFEHGDTSNVLIALLKTYYYFSVTRIMTLFSIAGIL